MPAHTATCPLCERTRDPTAPLRIAALRESVVFLHEHQAYPGWCVVVLNDHAEHLGDLPVARQLRLWEDVAQVAAAVHPPWLKFAHKTEYKNYKVRIYSF